MNLKKMLEGKRNARKGKNKGFSLVELIIVIAIMAIMVGVVGTQVLPYIEKSKEAKDYQIISSYCTAATAAYSSNAADVSANVVLNLETCDTATLTSQQQIIFKEFKNLTGYTSFSDMTTAMGSKNGKAINSMIITIDLTNKKVTVTTTTNPASDAFKEITSKL